jgi:DNA-binding beta-propeller fold protein YncE
VKVVGKVPTSDNSYEVVAPADGKTAFVSAVQSDYVLKIDLEKGEVSGKAATGQGPDGVALAGM